MQKTLRLGALLMSIATIPLAPPASHSLSIEGGDPSILEQKSPWGLIRSRKAARREAMREALRSVISMNVELSEGTAACSASLVGKNILLTSQHCTDSRDNPNNRLKTGSPLTLNGQAGFVAREIIRFGRTYAGPSDSPSLQTNTDLALIRVEISGSSPSFLDSLPVLPIASPEVAAILDDQILVSGYGVKSWYAEETGTLRYGLARKIDQIGEIGIKNYLSLRKNSELLPQHEFSQGQFYIAAIRTEAQTLKSKKGTPVRHEDFSRYTLLDGNPMGLPGDSGAPAIAFDGAHRPFLIGVASMTMANALHSDLVLSAIRNHRFMNPTPLLSASFPIPSMGLQSVAIFDAIASDGEISKKIFALLARKKLIDENGNATAPITITKTMTRLAIGIYTSTSHPLNQQFILNNLSGLDPERNAQ
jgi:hypothetical protein